MTGIVKGIEIAQNRDSNQNVVLLSCEINGSDDVQIVEYMTAPGNTTIPPLNSIVSIFSAGRSWKIAVACNDGIDADDTLKEGEKEFYSSDGGTKKAQIKLFSTGEIQIINDNNGVIDIKDDGSIAINGGSAAAAREGDATTSSSAEDSNFWAFFAAFFGIITGAPIPEPGNGAPSALQTALAAAITGAGGTPTSQKGKINAGSTTVEIG